MNKFILNISVPLIFFFSGCGATKGLEFKEYSQSDVKYEFKKGEVISSRKVIVSKDKIAFINGVVMGSGTGAIIGGATGGGVVQGAIIGGAVGGFGGYFTGLAVDGNEAEAFEINIRKLDDLSEHKAFVPYTIEDGTRLEFVLREKEVISNIRIE
jgi:hypothetical protein